VTHTPELWPAARRPQTTASVTLVNLDDVVGHEAMGLSMNGYRRLGVRSFDEAAFGASTRQ
jgi:hypothetical protein